MEANDKTIHFTPETEERMRNLLKRYPADRSKSALIPILHLAQAESDGWLSVPVMNRVAELLGLRPIEVYEVASFYTMFALEPRGRCLIEVCRTSSCWMRGAYDIIAHLENRLGIRAGETTPDGRFTLKTVECLGSCGTAPMLQIGERYYENLTADYVDRILDEHRDTEGYSRYVDETTFRTL